MLSLEGDSCIYRFIRILDNVNEKNIAFFKYFLTHIYLKIYLKCFNKPNIE